MVIVTKDNFLEVLEELEHVVKTCTFVAIDCEFSGLFSSSSYKNSLFDTADARYLKLKKNIEGFVILQFGLTAFRFDRSLNKYDAFPYNFYLMQRSFGPIDSRFSCQTSSVQFLCKNNFNFDGVFYGGISYINKPQEVLLREALESGALSCYEDQAMNHEANKFIGNASTNVSNWLKTATEGQTYTVLVSFDEELRYILHQELRSKFKGIWTLDIPSGVVVKKVSEKDLSELQKEAKSLEESTLESVKGFTKVFELLVKYKKPLVGHNLLLDLLAMYKNFYQPLPSTLKEFKKELHSLFPEVYDTKRISFEAFKNEKSQSLALENLYNYYVSNAAPQYMYMCGIESKSDFYNSEKGKQVHEAGWDSYMTGFIFIKMCSYIAVESETRSKRVMAQELLAAAKRWKNFVNVGRASLSYVNLEGADPASTRPPLLYVSTSGKTNMKFLNVATMLGKYGAVDIKQITPWSALVAVGNYGRARDIIRDFKNNNEYQITKYNFIKHSPIMKPVFKLLLTAIGGIVVWFSLPTSITGSKSC